MLVVLSGSFLDPFYLSVLKFHKNVSDLFLTIHIAEYLAGTSNMKISVFYSLEKFSSIILFLTFSVCFLLSFSLWLCLWVFCLILLFLWGLFYFFGNAFNLFSYEIVVFKLFDVPFLSYWCSFSWRLITFFKAFSCDTWNTYVSHGVYYSQYRSSFKVLVFLRYLMILVALSYLRLKDQFIYSGLLETIHSAPDWMGLDLPSVSSGMRSRTGSSMARFVGWRILFLHGLMARSALGWTPHKTNGRLRRVLLGGNHSHTLILSPHAHAHTLDMQQL